MSSASIMGSFMAHLAAPGAYREWFLNGLIPAQRRTARTGNAGGAEKAEWGMGLVSPERQGKAEKCRGGK
jgi:hypothetical protein